MKYNELNISVDRQVRRLGRGIAAGKGKTAGRGTKGQKARTGYRKKPGFQGGQNPIMQQLPKLPGFRSYKVKAENVNLDDLESIKAKVIDAQVLADNGLISNAYVRVKALASGSLKSPKTVSLPEASQGAIDSINKVGGSFKKVDRLKRPKKSSDSKV